MTLKIFTFTRMKYFCITVNYMIILKRFKKKQNKKEKMEKS